MKRLEFNLPDRFYGLIIGVYCVGVFRLKQNSFKWLTTRIVDNPYRMYGVCYGNWFYGWGNLPNYTRSDIKRALVALAKSEYHKNISKNITPQAPTGSLIPLNLFPIYKYDIGQAITAEDYKQALDYLDGKIELADAPKINFVELSSSRPLPLFDRRDSNSTIKSQQNYGKRNQAARYLKTKNLNDPAETNIQPESEIALASSSEDSDNGSS